MINPRHSRATILVAVAIASSSGLARGQVPLTSWSARAHASFVQEHARAVLQRPEIVCRAAKKYDRWTILDVATTGFRSGPVDPLAGDIGVPKAPDPVPAYVGSYTLSGVDGVRRRAYGSVFHGAPWQPGLLSPLRWEDGVLGQHIVTVDEPLPRDSGAANALMDRVLGGAGPRYLCELAHTRYHPQSGEPAAYWFVGRGLGALTFSGSSRFTVALGVIAAGPRCFVVHTTGFGKYAGWLEERQGAVD